MVARGQNLMESMIDLPTVILEHVLPDYTGIKHKEKRLPHWRNLKRYNPANFLHCKVSQTYIKNINMKQSG